ncbi:hypothetical protein A4X13_0g6169 [Tilletia indica]|uniref:Ndc10 domain-containing protein n=1 Tax=Tilletia indica TaxID=43049 RepID=A0A177TAX8_9BASI|nr:hypothetical protein A4X13_0g6169 [Tilletia indica]
MRKGGSRFAYEASCTEDAVRKHGRWCGDRMMERYLTGVSLQPVRALAGFQKDGGDYWLPRAMLEPPQELARMIFPWVESKEQDIKKRLLHGGESDAAALEFLAMLKFLRVVLLQDMAMLQETNTMLPLFTTAPFNTHAFSAWKEALKAKINSTPTPFEMSLESLMPAVCHALAAVRSAVEEIRTIISSATAELKAQVQALEIKSEERHGEVMGAVGAMLLMGQGGSKRNDTQAKAVQSLLVDGIKTVMSLIQQIQQISLNAELEPTSSITFNSSAGVAINTSSNLPSSELVVRSSSSPPGQHLASSPLPPQHQQQLQQMLHALQNVNTSASAPASASTTSAQSSGSSSAHVPCFSLPVVRNAVELWDEWSVGREGRDALEQIRIADESKHEEDRTFARRLASSAAIKQQVYRWSKVVAFIKERVEEDGVEGRVVARQLDEHIRRSRGKLLSPLRTMADLLLTDSGRDGLKRGILPSTPSAST